jgi:hypothetical protein
MPTKPTTAEIKARVVHDAAKAANLSPSSVTLTDVLADLGIDHFGFVFLAGSLRAYIQHTAPTNSLRVDEVEKDGLTVAQLRDLVARRV